MFISILFLIFSFTQQVDWKTYHEDNNVKISFKSHLCKDLKNGFSFEYYLIKVQNKTNETFVINFYKGIEEDEEQKIAFVLNPNEVRVGRCEYDPVKLRIFKSNNSQKSIRQVDKFNLTKVNVIKVN